jgi:hypothetical protein
MQEECEARLKVLEEAAASAQRMTSHGDADVTVGAFKVVKLIFSFCQLPCKYVCNVPFAILASGVNCRGHLKTFHKFSREMPNILY